MVIGIKTFICLEITKQSIAFYEIASYCNSVMTCHCEVLNKIVIDTHSFLNQENGEAIFYQD